MKLLRKLWFSKSLKKLTVSVNVKLSQVDEILEKIKPTNQNRSSMTLRSYSKQEANCKASEFRNFLLYFGIPILIDISSSIQMAKFMVKRNMPMNIHHFLHLCDNVVQLDTFLYFILKNHFILKTIHGSQKIEYQLQSTINRMYFIREKSMEKIPKN